MERMYNKIIGYKYVIGNFVKYSTTNTGIISKIGRSTLGENYGNYIMNIKIGNI